MRSGLQSWLSVTVLTPDRVPDFDAIVVLGGGVRSGGCLPRWAARRFDLALTQRRGEPILCLSAGTTHRALLSDENGRPIFESTAGARYLLQRGVAPKDILVETVSWDTIGNAYYSRLLFVDPFRWRKLLIITSKFHMPRSRAIFEWVYGMAPARYSLTFEASTDEDMDPGVLAARTEREQNSLALFEAGVRQEVHTFDGLHRWIYTTHKAYSADGRAGLERDSRTEVLESY